MSIDESKILLRFDSFVFLRIEDFLIIKINCVILELRAHFVCIERNMNNAIKKKEPKNNFANVITIIKIIAFLALRIRKLPKPSQYINIEFISFSLN